MKREVITDKRGIQVNPMELALLSQDIDPLHALLPLRIGFECILTPLHLGIARHFPKIHILLEVVFLPVADPLVEMPMNFREQVSDSQDPLEVEPGARQTGMVKLDPETPVYRAFDDQRTLLFFGDGSAAAPHPGDADIYRRLRYVTMDLAMTQVRTERHERVNGWVCENQSRNLAGRAVVMRVLETDDSERGGERSNSRERRNGDER